MYINRNKIWVRNKATEHISSKATQIILLEHLINNHIIILPQITTLFKLDTTKFIKIR